MIEVILQCFSLITRDINHLQLPFFSLTYYFLWLSLFYFFSTCSTVYIYCNYFAPWISSHFSLILVLKIIFSYLIFLEMCVSFSFTAHFFLYTYYSYSFKLVVSIFCILLSLANLWKIICIPSNLFQLHFPSL